ncbi:ceramidase [Yarrowia lipolytica]|uniref:YALI0D20262p n=2 Tax=Yarrowia lipolytica TaxID=4952 RepID=Q6C8E6_YARLI|nr:YALI0D20262p [Yarrowia lipolytica CLIB122]AOW04357.1 hypothetical protein YALI1_D25664g [Yarrowia lipolytica]KAB8285815.1 ceramidase [Yarrowia lipolytica]KAE8171842.1 ceramidase [Yarrowia lipolytica]KAJ8054152.1 ceramidase [Yarrowia lipolytica]QNP97986.1 Alkaline ceramidase 3 [Yarrowia lipolytica]|eukprot:XP_503066.1 YALI0D20262p [Yarrowia lipolytica CLIB122]
MLPGGIPYPPPVDNGYWGPTTSTIDWCEENYVVSKYVAEIMNTTTNAVFMIMALYTIINVYREKHHPTIIFAAIGFFIVGFGSWMFHMTLWYEFQLLDELPMIYATCVPLYIVFSNKKSNHFKTLLGVGIAAGALLLTAIYLHNKNPTFHQAAYGILNFIVIGKSVALTKAYISDQKTKNLFWRLLALGLFSFLFGYFLWNLDIHLCNQWIKIRREVGLPYGLVIEGHAWWHIFTGLGVYIYIVYLCYLQVFLAKRQHLYHFLWWCGFFPHVDLLPEAKSLWNKLGRAPTETEMAEVNSLSGVKRVSSIHAKSSSVNHHN